jgi:hypothetical protein
MYHYVMTDEDSYCLVTFDRHVSAATDTNATIEKLLGKLLSMRSVTSLYNDNTSQFSPLLRTIT